MRSCIKHFLNCLCLTLFLLVISLTHNKYFLHNLNMYKKNESTPIID